MTKLQKIQTEISSLCRELENLENRPTHKEYLEKYRPRISALCVERDKYTKKTKRK